MLIDGGSDQIVLMGHPNFDDARGMLECVTGACLSLQTN